MRKLKIFIITLIYVILFTSLNSIILPAFAYEKYVEVGSTIYNLSNVELAKLKDGRILIYEWEISPLDLSNPLPKENRYKKYYEIFDPKIKKFIDIPQPTCAGHPITLDDGRVLILGSKCTQIYNPLNNNVKDIENMKIPRKQFGITKLNNGKILITNGYNSLSNKYIGVFKAEIFDPESETFSLTGESAINITNINNIRQADTSAKSILLNNGEVLILWINQGVAEIYTPETGNFRKVGNLLKNRNSSFPITSVHKLPNGKVILISGSSQDAYNFAEIFNPATETFYNLGELAIKRKYTSKNINSVELKDGKILVWGGENPDQSIFKNNVPINSMEIFDPKLNKFKYLNQIPPKYNFYKAITLDDGTVFFLTRSIRFGQQKIYGVIYKENNDKL